MFYSGSLETGGKADVAGFFCADFKQCRQLEALGYMLGFLAVTHCMGHSECDRKKPLLKYPKN